MRVTYIGNFDPVHSTENEIRKALIACGHDVTLVQESDWEVWENVQRLVSHADVLLWTRTNWTWLDKATVHARQREMLDIAKNSSVPTVGYHLDRWWGLSRQQEIENDPYFRVSLLITADGGHQDLWDSSGVNHVWLPPAISEYEIPTISRENLFDPNWDLDLVFVGSSETYHQEWQHRRDLVNYLEANGCRFVPELGQPAIRGAELQRIYASAKIAVGDSCMVGNTGYYWSDRIPETLGRGGFLLHPDTAGLSECFTNREHLVTWELGDWDELSELIAFYLSHDEERLYIASQGMAHVRANHTYTKRMEQVLGRDGILVQQGLLA